MSLMDLFRRRNSAPVARERLQVLLAHERAVVGQSDLLAVLKEEILAVIARHVVIEHEKVQVKLERGGAVSILEIDVEVPKHFGERSGERGAGDRAVTDRAGTGETPKADETPKAA